MAALFARLGHEIEVVVHCAGQPSHDWAATEPLTDWDVNAGGTLNLLEATRLHAPEAVFIFCSTNKVYGDRAERAAAVRARDAVRDRPRPPVPRRHRRGPVDRRHACTRVFGASKVAADVMVQEYGRYFGLRTTCFRGGTITGPQHAAAELHGFLAYVMRCALAGREYTIFGYKGKQVRDAIHSQDLVRAFDCVFREPRVGEVYNIGGGRQSNCSVLEAIALVSEITGRELALALRRAEPDRRPHLVDRVERAVRRALPGLAPGVRRAADPGGAARREPGALARVIDDGKRLLLGVRIDAVDYEGALARILAAAREGRSLGVSALAVHGVMTGVLDREQRCRINHLDLVTPDGQPVRWALNRLYGTRLPGPGARRGADGAAAAAPRGREDRRLLVRHDAGDAREAAGGAARGATRGW